MEQIRHYRIVEKLGSGGMGVVYKAFDTVLERDVAIKVMHPHLLNEGKNEQRLMNEARAAARLVHPNIVTVYEVGEEECGRFIVMEYVDGTPLSDIMDRKEPVDSEFALKTIAQVLRGLEAAHTQQILHRDIKADNILVGPNDLAKILDFGIAKISAGKGLTVAGDVLGTVEYMAPEQMMGDVVDQRGDLYSTGVILYQLLTEQLPFTGETPVAILYKQLNEEPVPPSHYNSSINQELNRIIMRALAKSPDDRWQSAGDFAEALERIVRGDVSASEATISGIEPPAFTPSEDEEDLDNENALRSAFVGREPEFKKLIKLYRRGCGGEGQTVVLMGEAGVGKSTLAARLQDYARHNKALVLYGACLYQDGMDSYLPFIDALRTFFTEDIRNYPEEERMNLKGVVREKVPLLMEFTERFNTRFSGNPLTPDAANEARTADQFEGIHLLISLLSQTQPVVLVIDDLQWADEASLRLFHYLARQIARNRVFLVGISRTDRYDLQQDGKPALIVDVLARMRREGVYEQINIDRLSREECDELVENALVNTIFSEEFFDKVYRETKGNPFFVLETLKFLQETGRIYFENDAWYDKQDDQPFEVPNRVEDVFIRRLNGLTEEERELLQVAAIIGYKFDASVLATIIEMQKIKLLKTLQHIDRDLQILISTENGFQFEHPMLRDLLYNEVPIALRKEYHMMIADELDNMYGPEYGALIGDVAQHFHRGGLISRAIPLLFKAASRSFKISAYREASIFYEDVMSCVPENEDEFPEEVPPADLYLKLGICYEETARWDSSIETYAKLLKYCENRDEPQGQVDALRRMARVYERHGNTKGALENLDRCLTILESHPMANTLSRIYNSMGVIFIQTGDFEQALSYFHKTTEVVDHELGEYDRAHALTNIGIIHNIRGEHEEAVKFYQEALEIYNQIKDAKGMARIHHNLGMTFSDLQRWEESIASFEACFEIADKTEDKQLRALTLMNMGKAYARQDNPDKAEEYTAKSLKIFRRAGDMLNIAEAYLVLGMVYTSRRDFARAEKYYQDSIKINQQKDYPEGVAEGYLAYAELNRESGDRASALENYAQAKTLYEELNLKEKVEQIGGIIEELVNSPDSDVTVVKMKPDSAGSNKKYELHTSHN